MTNPVPVPPSPNAKEQLPALRGARIRRVIEVEFTYGSGTKGDMVRRVFAYYDMKHADTLLAWADPQDYPRRIDPSFLATGWRG